MGKKQRLCEDCDYIEERLYVQPDLPTITALLIVVLLAVGMVVLFVRNDTTTGLTLFGMALGVWVLWAVAAAVRYMSGD